MKLSPYQQHKYARKMLDEILSYNFLSPYVLNSVKRARDAMELQSMPMVLAHVPGKTVVEQARSVGVSRNTWYQWHRGEVRPSRPQAKRLAALTGIPMRAIAGRR